MVMRSLLLQLVGVLVLASQGHSLAASETPLLDVLYLLRGTFVNAEEVKEDIERGRSNVHTLIGANVMPVDIPALRPAYTVFLEEDADETVKRLNLLQLSADDDVNIKVQISNFTDRPQLLPLGSFYQWLRDLQPSDLESREECTAYMTQVERGVFLGTWPDCTTYSNGVPRRYTMMYTCNALSGTIWWENDIEKASPLSYVLRRVGERPPLVPSWLKDVPNYTSPCPGS